MDPNTPVFLLATNTLNRPAINDDQRAVHRICQWWVDQINTLEICLSLKPLRFPEIEQ